MYGVPSLHLHSQMPSQIPRLDHYLDFPPLFQLYLLVCLLLHHLLVGLHILDFLNQAVIALLPTINRTE